MRKDLTQLVVISDRSGSMGGSNREESEGAINRLINEQADPEKAKGECLLTLVEFDDVYDILCDSIDIREFKKYSLEPRGMTALYDAIGKTINTVDQSISNMKEEEQPGLVIVIISTDGLNNASREFNGKQVADMIEAQKEKNWQFVFVGVEIDAEAVAKSMNIDAKFAVSMDRNCYASGMQCTTSNVTNARNQVFEMGSLDIHENALAYTDVDKENLKS